MEYMSANLKKPTRRKASRVLVKNGKAAGRQVTFGSVTVRANPIDKKQAQANVTSGQLALERIRSRLLTAGVKLSPPKGVPLYDVDPDHPDEVIRRVGDKVERGRLVNGEFLVTE